MGVELWKYSRQSLYLQSAFVTLLSKVVYSTVLLSLNLNTISANQGTLFERSRQTNQRNLIVRRIEHENQQQ